MVCQCWLFMVLMGFMCSSGSGSVCLESSTCNDLSNKNIIQDCLHLCTPETEPEIKPPGVRGQQENDDFGDPEESHRGDLLLNIILSTLASGGKVPEGDLKAHDDRRRSYAMEHFRWGKPFGRKRRPVKVFPSALDEEAFPLRARRHLSWNKAESKGGVVKGRHQNKDLLGPRAGFRSRATPERKAETYRMSHFRWGSPPASKQNNGFGKLWEEKPREKLTKLFKNILVKDVKMIMG
ncbi:pro-opiomelanocortin-like [Poecilia reticulata]|uniref:Proopiomelanocortin n=1 Tax=Poecilia reticulata TaxID=8081 RepID=A0A3P9MVG6_POERE|nr:PREDICTED: pro-opiomelanocortin-like [Poecilia reticulata]